MKLKPDIRLSVLTVVLIVSVTCTLTWRMCTTESSRKLPEYYLPYIEQKVAQIEELRKYEADGFFFWTDMHFPDNAGNAAAILDYMQGELGECKLFNGGDAILNSDSLAPGLKANSRSWTQAGRYGTLFPIRGNHDYTSSTSARHERPETMTQKQVSEYIASYISSDAVRGPDPAANYYYVDSKTGKIRYVVLDSTDSVKDGRIIYGISQKQYAWIFKEVVATLPSGWKLFFLSHVPLAPDHTDCRSLLNVGETIGSIGDKVLMVLSGHRHSDLESGIGRVFQVLTSGDCLDDSDRTVTPYSLPLKEKQQGTVNEQSIDYVSISGDYTKVTMKRIGNGYDRIYNVCPVVAQVGETVVLEASAPAPVRWFVFDAVGNRTSSWNGNGYRDYDTSHKNASISSDGSLSLVAPGCSIAVATYADGTKEFFMVDARQPSDYKF